MDTDIRSKIAAAAARHKDQLARLSDDLYGDPEISGEEHRSCEKLAALMRGHGFDVTVPFGGYDTAFNAEIKNGDGPIVALMAEYDALPGVGHGCGHNISGCMSALAGIALGELKDCFHGTLRVVGTPAEEGDGAKLGMAARGIFDDCDLAMMIHCTSGPTCPPNTDALALSCWDVEFFGTPAHSSGSPWNGRSALAAARKFLDLVDARRECFTPDARANAIITDGGLAPNVIPEHAAVRIEVRTSTRASLDKMRESVLKCARCAAEALDCTTTCRRGYQDDFFDMVRVPALEEMILGIYSDLGIATEPVKAPSGSTDVANVSYRCPAIQPYISIIDEKTTGHTCEFADATKTAKAHDAMERGAVAMALAATRVFNDADARAKIRADFEQALKAKA